MKKTKLLSMLLTAILAIATVFSLAACNDEETSGDATYALLVREEKLVVIEANSTGGSLEDALKYFKSAGELDYTGSTSVEFGLMLESVNGYTPDSSKNEFWAVYTSLTEYEGVLYSGTDYGSYEYEGTVCGSANYGVSGLPMIEGYLYVFAISTY